MGSDKNKTLKTVTFKNRDNLQSTTVLLFAEVKVLYLTHLKNC